MRHGQWKLVVFFSLIKDQLDILSDVYCVVSIENIQCCSSILQRDKTKTTNKKPQISLTVTLKWFELR